MKRILKIMSVFLAFLLVVGCGTSKSVTQQLAGEYETYTESGKVYESITLEEPKSSDDTSGNASYDLHDSSHTVYYGTYKVYEKSKTVVIDYDDYSLSGDRIELTYNLGKKTMKYRDNGKHIYVFEKK